MANKTYFGKKHVMEQVHEFRLSHRHGHAHRAVSNRAILKALAGGASVARFAKSSGVPKSRVRRLAKRYETQGGSPATGAGGVVIWTRRHRKGGSMASPGPQGGTIGIEKHGNVIGPARSHGGLPTGIVGVAGSGHIGPTASPVVPSTVAGPEDTERQIRALLIQHLGSENAADVWLNSTRTGYPTTALDVIRAGKADLVLDDLEHQWGPSPSYA
jgi:hypothetical protein